MPLFADIAAMQERFKERDLVQLTDEAGTGAIDSSMVERALTSADALITGYIAARYQDTATFAGQAILTDVACDYAFSLLWQSDAPDWVMAKRKAAIDALKDIASGKIKLDAGIDTAAPRADQIIVSGPERRFSRDSMGGF